MTGLRHLAGELATLRQADLLRTPRADIPEGALVLCSNDYLGYAARPFLPSPEQPAGAGASRLVCGDAQPLRALERDIASWLKTPRALLFSSGYAANLGLISALAGVGDLVVSDALNHASIIDGCRLSRAAVAVTPHLDCDAVEKALRDRSARRKFVVTESYFSMDGDGPDLVSLRAICDRHDAALIVDDAHAIGVFGEAGRGICAELGVVPDALVGTLGKSVGAQGAFVAGSEELRHWLWNRARSFVFSTGASPALAASIRVRLAEMIADDAARVRLDGLCRRFRNALLARGAPIPREARGPIVPWLIGSAANAIAASQALQRQGVFVQPIRPPTVPEGSARLRITLRADLSDAELDRAIDALTTLLPSSARAS